MRKLAAAAVTRARLELIARQSGAEAIAIKTEVFYFVANDALRSVQ
jgi:hypothetical protein